MEDGTAASAAYTNTSRQFPWVQIPFSLRTTTCFFRASSFWACLIQINHAGLVFFFPEEKEKLKQTTFAINYNKNKNMAY